MSRYSIIPREDLGWLRDVHLKGVDITPYVGAYVYGNEDCPDRIECYAEDRYDGPVDVYLLQVDGTYLKTASVLIAPAPGGTDDADEIARKLLAAGTLTTQSLLDDLGLTVLLSLIAHLHRKTASDPHDEGEQQTVRAEADLLEETSVRIENGDLPT